MARVPPSGVMAITPEGGISALRIAINSISQAVPLGDFTDEELNDILCRLALVIGNGVQSKSPILRPKTSPPERSDALTRQSSAFMTYGSVDSETLQDTLQKASDSCEFLLNLLDVKTGFQIVPPVNLEARGRIIDWLSKNPEVSQNAELFVQIDAIMRGVNQLKQASDLAGFELSESKFSSGRPKNDWYDGFAALLISICQSRDIRPSLGRDSQTEKPSGNLFVLAMAMEELLPKELRSGSDEACFQRLKTARKSISKRGKTTPTLL